MKYLDRVRVIKDRDEYSQEGIFKGMIGTISDGEIRDRCFHVAFIDERVKDKEFMSIEGNIFKLKDDIFCAIKIEDLELVEDMKSSDEWILSAIPKHNPNWYCKVENGFIVNLQGEKLNKIPYDYNS